MKQNRALGCVSDLRPFADSPPALCSGSYKFICSSGSLRAAARQPVNADSCCPSIPQAEPNSWWDRDVAIDFHRGLMELRAPTDYTRRGSRRPLNWKILKCSSFPCPPGGPVMAEYNHVILSTKGTTSNYVLLMVSL